MVNLREITMDNFIPVIKLKLNETDKRMVATNGFSLAEAYVDKVSQPRGIYDDDKLVGFVMYDFNQKEKKGYISRLMVADEFQGNGYGRQGLLLAMEELRKNPDMQCIQISYHPDNIKARTLYLDIGFVENGEQVDGEDIAIYDIL